MSRPRTISKEDSLERALLLFWERGYDRTSIADLSAAIGVGPSSIYNTFGSKEDLFREAIGRYVGTYADTAMQLVGTDNGEGAFEFVRGFMRELVKLYTTKGQPTGCAIFQAGGAGVPTDSSACAITNEVKGSLQGLLRKRFEAYAKAGEELTASPKTLALFVVSTMRGISQLACDGATRAELMKVAEHASQSCLVAK
ncbi:MAG: AcrR family transcriptional regulator [Planctomycetota bacterium]|jgi:AcrR family transcriptional regulator